MTPCKPPCSHTSQRCWHCNTYLIDYEIALPETQTAHFVCSECLNHLLSLEATNYHLEGINFNRIEWGTTCYA